MLNPEGRVLEGQAPVISVSVNSSVEKSYIHWM